MIYYHRMDVHRFALRGHRLSARRTVSRNSTPYVGKTCSKTSRAQCGVAYRAGVSPFEGVDQEGRGKSPRTNATQRSSASKSCSPGGNSMKSHEQAVPLTAVPVNRPGVISSSHRIPCHAMPSAASFASYMCVY